VAEVLRRGYHSGLVDRGQTGLHHEELEAAGTVTVLLAQLEELLVTEGLLVRCLSNLSLEDGQRRVDLVAEAQLGEQTFADSLARVNTGDVDDKELLVVGGGLQ
jgi:hypothetical protein